MNYILNLDDEPNIHPEGEYVFKVRNINIEPHKVEEFPIVKYELELYETSGAFVGIFENLFWCDPAKVRKMKWIIEAFFKTVGYRISGKFDVDSFYHCVGRSGILKLEVVDGRNRVGKFYPKPYGKLVDVPQSKATIANYEDDCPF